MKIIFENKISKDSYGDYRYKNRNHTARIRVFNNAPDKLKTLIHELIHSFLSDKMNSGYKSRILKQLNDDNSFVDGLAVRINDGIISTLETSPKN